MTKKWHKCDDSCKINHVAVPKQKAKITPKTNVLIEKKINVVKKKTVILSEHVKFPLLEEIEFYICKIDCEIETNKILEKTIIKLRKLEKDIG
jgi:hypothetical protein